jgi:Protein of unknown function (DUF2726)
MKPLFVFVPVLLAIAILINVLRAWQRRQTSELKQRWPLEPKRYLLTERERELFQRLRAALPDYLVLAQVQVIQLLAFERGRWTRGIFNRMCQLSVDFVILRPDTSIVAAIELDDATHARTDRRDADARKTHALQSAGIQLVRWNAKALPDSTAIATAFASPLR